MKRGIFILIVLLSLSFVSASQLQVTLEHPFLVNGNWISASSLQVGQILENIDGKQVRIIGIEKVSQSVNVFNIETSSNNYVVSSLVVHNSNLISKEPIVAEPVLPPKSGEKFVTLYHGSSGPEELTYNLQRFGPLGRDYYLTPERLFAERYASYYGCGKVLTYKIPVQVADSILGDPFPVHGFMGKGLGYRVGGGDLPKLHQYFIPEIN